MFVRFCLCRLGEQRARDALSLCRSISISCRKRRSVYVWYAIWIKLSKIVVAVVVFILRVELCVRACVPAWERACVRVCV